MGSQSRARKERALTRAAAARLPEHGGAAFGLVAADRLQSTRDGDWLNALTAEVYAEIYAAALPPAETTAAASADAGPVAEQPRQRVYGFGLRNGRAQAHSPRLPYDRAEIVALVARRRRARRALQRLDDAIELEVDRARTSGMSWDEIGQLLGITRQGARQRYGDRVVHSDDRGNGDFHRLGFSPPFGRRMGNVLSDPRREAVA